MSWCRFALLSLFIYDYPVYLKTKCLHTNIGTNRGLRARGLCFPHHVTSFKLCLRRRASPQNLHDNSTRGGAKGRGQPVNRTYRPSPANQHEADPHFAVRYTGRRANCIARCVFLNNHPSPCNVPTCDQQEYTLVLKLKILID